jgi:hypothetical protein
LVGRDVYVYDSWWSNVSPFIDHENVGMVLGFADAPVNKLPIYDAYLKFRARREGAVAFSNTLVKRALVLECRESLRGVHAGEDDVVARYVRRRGMKIVTIPKSLCYHDKDPFETHARAYYRSGESARIRYGIRGIRLVPDALRGILVGWWHFSCETGIFSLRLLIFLGRLWLNYVRGYIS